MIRLIEQEERKHDTNLQYVLETNDETELLRVLTALILHRYSLDRSRHLPNIPNNNLKLYASAITIVLSGIGIIIWLVCNFERIAEFIFEDG